MKKIVILLLCFVLVFSVISCKKGEQETVTEKAPAITAAVEETTSQEVTNVKEETPVVKEVTPVVAEETPAVEEVEVPITDETPAVVKTVVEAPVQTENFYQFNLNGAEITAVLKNGIATVNYPKNITNKEISKGLYYIGIILNVNTSDFTYKFNQPGEVVLTYPANMSDEKLISGFKMGLNYYLTYYDYTTYTFDLYGFPIFAAVKDGNAFVAYPSEFKKSEVEGLLVEMVKDINATDDYTYNMIGNRVVEITYPSSISNQNLINGFSAEFTKVLPTYLNQIKVLAQSQENFDKEFKNFEFYLQGIHVTGAVNQNEVIFNYDSEMFDNYLKTQLVKIASSVTAYDASDLSYTSGKGQLTFTFTEKIDPNMAINTFFGEIFSL